MIKESTLEKHRWCNSAISIHIISAYLSHLHVWWNKHVQPQKILLLVDDYIILHYIINIILYPLWKIPWTKKYVEDYAETTVVFKHCSQPRNVNPMRSLFWSVRSATSTTQPAARRGAQQSVPTNVRFGAHLSSESVAHVHAGKQKKMREKKQNRDGSKVITFLGSIWRYLKYIGMFSTF